MLMCPQMQNAAWPARDSFGSNIANAAPAL
jgi:hypothetical protein